MYESGFCIENNILKGDETSPRNDYTSLGKFVLDRLENNLDFVGQVDTVTGEEYTHKKMRERSVRCALWMKTQGLLPGDVVAICSQNQLDVAMPCFAALYLGAVFTPLEAGLSRKEFCHLLSVTEPKIAFVSKELVAVIAEAAKDAKLVPKIVVFGQVDGFLEFESIITQPKINEVEKFECTPIEEPDTTAFVVSTSGTTGSPKGVALGHAAILKQLHLTDKIGMSRNILLLFTSISWITGTLNMFWCLCSNITRLIPPPFEEYSACEIIEKYKVNWIFMAPNMINRLVQSGALNRYNLSSLTHVFCGGSSLTCASQEAFLKFVPNVRINIGYGSTEIGGVLTVQGKKIKPGSSGRIVDNAQLKVIDPDTGRTLGPNQQGELLTKTATMMKFYYRNPQATAEAVDEEGWFHSGDLGYYDEDGEVFVVDRLKELIKYRGYHISPSDIENLISFHPAVKDVAVVGLPHPQDDEHPTAFVVKRANSIDIDNETIERELIELVATEFSDSKRLRGGVRFIDHIPRTPQSNKIQRRILRDLARSVVIA